jgi:hypothetical protein
MKENSADRQPVVQLTSPKAGTLEVIRRVQIKLDLILKKSKNVMLWVIFKIFYDFIVSNAL